MPYNECKLTLKGDITMGLKTWLVGLGLFGATSGAVAQTGEQKTDDKQDHSIETVTKGSSEESQVTPVIKLSKFQYRFEQDEDGMPTVKVDIPLAKKRVYNKSAMRRLGLSEEDLYDDGRDGSHQTDFAEEEDNPHIRSSLQEQPEVTVHSNDSTTSEQTTNATINSIMRIREEFYNNDER